MKRKYSFDDKKVVKKARTQGAGSGFASSDRGVRPLASPVARPEVKYTAGTLSISAIDTGTIGAFSVPSNGTGPSARIGDRYKVLKLEANWNALAGDTTNVVRVTIFQWRPDDANDSPTLAKLFQHTAVPAISVFIGDVRARRKFRVLYDRTVALSAQGPASMVGNISLDEKMFAITDVNSADTGINKVYYVVSSDSGAATHPALILSATMYFADA